MPFTIGCAPSSTLTRAGSDGQLLAAEPAATHELGEPRPRVAAEARRHGTRARRRRRSCSVRTPAAAPACEACRSARITSPHVAEIRVVQVVPVGRGRERVAAVAGPGGRGRASPAARTGRDRARRSAVKNASTLGTRRRGWLRDDVRRATPGATRATHADRQTGRSSSPCGGIVQLRRPPLNRLRASTFDLRSQRRSVICLRLASGAAGRRHGRSRRVSSSTPATARRTRRSPTSAS